jgi:hypothetical protein
MRSKKNQQIAGEQLYSAVFYSLLILPAMLFFPPKRFSLYTSLYGATPALQRLFNRLNLRCAGCLFVEHTTTFYAP